jgi:hemolysin III
VTDLRQPLQAATVTDRPRLRGWIHGLAAPLAVAVAVLLAGAASPGLPRTSTAVFGVGLVALYLTSSIYHVPRWPATCAGGWGGSTPP